MTTIHVTREDIDAGGVSPFYSDHPIAIAIMRQVRCSNVVIIGEHILLFDDVGACLWRGELSLDTRLWKVTYNAMTHKRDEIRTHSFDLDIPAEFLREAA